jgi:hypothetical protein
MDWKRGSLHIMILLYVGSTWSIFELEMRFETWITWNEVNGISLFHISYLITLMDYLRSQRKPKVQIKYFMFEWSIYRLFVTNIYLKHESLHIMIFVYDCSTWGIIKLKTRFETWIKRNDVNGVILIHFYYLIILMAYMCSQWAPTVQNQ